MIKSWADAKNILIIRADNMGDLIMSTPAIRALKITFSAKITVLTSSMAAGIVPHISEIDELLVFDLPWIKAHEVVGNEAILILVQQLKEKKFDAALVFTVFSQSAMPAAMIAYMAGIPLRASYSRENPYHLLTSWQPDKEPYTFIHHQVMRDLALVNSVGATTDDLAMRLNVPVTAWATTKKILSVAGIDFTRPWLVFHAGVSEKKREYPKELWIKAAQKLIREKGVQILFTGSLSEKELCNELAVKAGEMAFSVAGLLQLQEFIALIKESAIVVSVNTGTIHIAAAVNTPVVVLYAQTNPQHTPWLVPSVVLEFEVEEADRSKNEVIQFLYKEVYNKSTPMPDEHDVYYAVNSLLAEIVQKS